MLALAGVETVEGLQDALEDVGGGLAAGDVDDRGGSHARNTSRVEWRGT